MQRGLLTLYIVLATMAGCVFFLDAQDGSLDLVRQAVGLPIRCPTAIILAMQTAVLVAVEDLVG